MELLVSGFEKYLTVRQMVEKRAEGEIEIYKNMHFINEVSVSHLAFVEDRIISCDIFGSYSIFLGSKKLYPTLGQVTCSHINSFESVQSSVANLKKNTFKNER